LIMFDEHPYLGAGMGHFKYYWVDMDIISPYLKRSLEFYNRHSPHNTYISILAGAGIFAFICIILIQVLVIRKGVFVLLSFEFDPRSFIFLSFFGMSIYFYVISQAFGAITWFCIGYGMSLLNNKEMKKV